MLIDHIFIFVRSKQDVDALVDFGLTEGSGRVHQGIGTANRRFFFDNFYLEILWVENELEAKSVPEIGIAQRGKFQNSGFSRFGLCMKNTKDTVQIFEQSIKWQPMFLPKGQSVDIVTNDKMPWIFRFPPNRSKTHLSQEPRAHKAGLTHLSKAIFSLREIEFENKLNAISDVTCVEFKQAPINFLTLEFDGGKRGKTRSFKKLNLIINN